MISSMRFIDGFKGRKKKVLSMPPTGGGDQAVSTRHDGGLYHLKNFENQMVPRCTKWYDGWSQNEIKGTHLVQSEY